MSAVCSICTHLDRSSIDEALIAGTTYRDIAERYGVTPSSLTRHRQRHLSPAIVAIAAERGNTIADRVETLYDRASAVLASAESGGQSSLSLAAIRELRSICELLARLSGELDTRPQVNVLNLQGSPDWIELRTLIMTALSPHPQARVAVVDALGSAAAPKAIES